MDNLRIFLINECDTVVTDKDENGVIEWYRYEYDFKVGDDEIILEEKSLSNTMWYTGHLEPELEEELLDELDYADYNTDGRYMIRYGEVYELLTFEEVLGYQNYYNGKHKTYVIASTEW